jgi:hypothetical protein
MPITISGTTVTFNDSSTQTTNVPNATAALSVGAVGTYAFLLFPSNTTARAAGFTVAGSSLRYSGVDGEGSPTQGYTPAGATPGGTWMLMGQLANSTVSAGKTTFTVNATTSVWLRIS